VTGVTGLSAANPVEEMELKASNESAILPLLLTEVGRVTVLILRQGTVI